MKSRLDKARRIVVKIGSALLVDAKTGTIKASWLSSLIDDLADCRVKGAEIIIVSSGAIALGRRTLGLPKGDLRLEQKQAAAAVGQIALAQAWTEALRTRNMVAAQVLVTLTDTEERRRYLNARATLSTLLEQGAVPVINENDTVATSEIRYGDNDRLAARVASMMSADCLVLLSDIDGLYTAPPNQKGAVFLPLVEEITPEIEAMAGKPVSGVGSGGMITKIEAGKIALGAGCNMVISSGHEIHPHEAHSRWRALHLVRRQCLRPAIAQALDCGNAATGWPPRGGRGRCRGARQGKEPAAGGRAEGRRQLHARRHRIDHRGRRARDRARTCGL